MKKSILLFLFLGLSFNAISQELNPNAQMLKDNDAKAYKSIKTFSEKKWKQDYGMVLYEINKQVDALFGVLDILDKSNNSKSVTRIFSNALDKWSNGKFPNGEFTSNPTVDWSMVLYEMNKQIKAKNAY